MKNQSATFIVKIIIVLIVACSLSTNAISSTDNARKQTVDSLTKKFHQEGWDGLNFLYSDKSKNTVTIQHNKIIQNDPLTDGQLVNALGTILTPATVKKLKAAGFTKGELVDGKSRKYPFDISTKYYNKMQGFFKKMSNGR